MCDANSREHSHGSGNEASHDIDRKEKSRSWYPHWGKIAEVRIWNKRPDGLPIKISTTETVGEFDILEFKRMFCVTEEYVTRARNIEVVPYESMKSA
jgi:hypothetical protein